jgi:uncharacterized membrane protein YeaQ/YmgE (transglycosylase-associated protein family)
MRNTFMNISCLILQIVSGIAAGNLLAGGLKSCHSGILCNTLAGALGGGVGGQIFLRVTGIESDFHSSDAQIFLTSVFGAASGGVILTFVVGAIKRLLSRSS